MKILSLKNYSFTTKIILTFFIFVIIFMSIRFILIVPKVEQESLNDEIENIHKFLLITKEQIKIMSDVLENSSNFEKKLVKEEIENEIKKLDLKSKDLSLNEIINLIKDNTIINYCSYNIQSNEFFYEKLNKNRADEEENFFDKNNNKIFKSWIEYKLKNKSKKFIPMDYQFYNYKIDSSNLLLSIQCSENDFNPNIGKLKGKIKEKINSNLLIDSTLKKTKFALFWINPEIDINSNKIFFEENIDKRKDIYNLGVSNVKNLPTSSLTIKEIFEIKDKKPIEYILNNETVISWIIDLSSKEDNYLFLIYTVNKKELEDKNKTKILFLLPEIIAISISFILMLFLFRRMLKNIDTITKTAISVNKGEKNIRSNVKGEDDIGILGKSFDSMLDFFENSIKTLDKKVEEKTKEISKSLEEKEILLKEIHHRVKNNLALTISLLELQEEEIEDEKTKKVLIDIIERIHTMELLHRKLYESPNLNKISLKSYVIDLIEAISKTYDKQKKVNISFEIENIDLDIETTMPYGLILNELVTNAFKYAFKNQKNPQLQITISKQEDEKILLIVKDSGKGLLGDFSRIANETLGLRLINMIVKYQLIGNITYEYENGAKFSILGKIKE